MEATRTHLDYKGVSYTNQYTPQMAALRALALEIVQDTQRLGEAPTIDGSLPLS